MPACFSCQSNLSADDIYCPSCGIQVQCKNHECGSWLKSNARFCNVCGTSVGEGIAGTSSRQAVTLSPAVNKLEYKDKECSLKTEFTNEVSESLGIQIGSILGTRIGAKAAQRQHTYIQTTSALEDSHLLLPATVPALSESENEVTEQTVSVSAKSSDASPDAESLKQIFRDKGDRFKLNDPRLKAGSKLDYARRLTYTFLFAYEELKGQDQVSCSNLNDILNDAGVYDGNTSTWLKNTPDLSIEEGMIELRVTGREAARKVLREFSDPNIEDKWQPGSTSRGRGKTISKDNVDETSAGSKSVKRKFSVVSKDVEEWTKNWNALALGVNGHSVIKDCSVAEKGIFALWAIRRATSDAHKVVSAGRLANFLYQAFEIKVDERSIRRALKEIANKGKVIQVAEGFQLQPPGMEAAAKMAGLTRVSGVFA
ncbi:MAG: zinc ribbon domain-containing protein [Lyngbya sp. HA4199-MV5]|jgi:hypothetical protein|nr:zinc ribbon domain-containing protein [Lyngbya sp. HA4199-MV5]